MKKLLPLLVVCILVTGLYAQAPTTRSMNLMTWQEFQKFVPEKIETVLLPLGSLEAHGVIPNGTDNLCPESMGEAICERLNALVAPTLNYGITPSLAAYAGAVSISPEVYKPFVREMLTGLAAQNFKNIIILNGHGGNTNVLRELIQEMNQTLRVRMLIINWWGLAEEETFEVFGENGGHAGNNETAYVQAIVPEHIHPEWYDKDLALPNAKAGAYYASPSAASIGLYEAGQGYPTFDKKQAEDYFRKVNEKVAATIEKVIKNWDRAGLYR